MERMCSTVTVSIPQGALRGRRLKTASGRTYCSFQGIPYAKPPVGPLRFKSPEPPEPWSGIRNATKEGNIAPQIDFLMRSKTEYEGDEDCLYLNVYTSKLPTGDNAQLIPVMVWIHGGAFLLGSGNTELYGPDYLMEHDVLLVTFNYRLGVLGFLSTEDELVPGNAGLKDMVMALKWVKSNIARFGGDPGNVTIFGESAGSMSCHILSISSAAKGLFQRVICQSGIPIKGLMGSGGKEQAFGLARALGFTGNTTEELVAFLMEQPARKLVEHAPEAVTKERLEIPAMAPFIPSIEPPGVPDSVLTQDPYDILSSGKFTPVPRIVGVTSREGLIFTQVLNVDKAALRELNLNFQRALPATIPVKKEERIAVARDVKRFYFDNQPLDESTIDLYADLHADLVTIYPSVVTTRILSSMPAAQPTYFYHFDVTTKLNVFKKMYGEQFSGVSHCDDLPYLFSEDKTKDIPKGPETEEGKAIARMTRLWTNFAKTGNPTPDPADPMLSVTWLPFKKDEEYYLDITNDGLSSKKDLMKDRVDFWDRIFRM
ncbi:juvenile hormone esterase-like isoform X3 [Schistocerca nitens]|uniref:juvenile hormone esterase-like isoform X3 n=1 Tax=Schistocerca nitens TaxID=7011 RepID=UPI002118524C|nr:juvenile hormone esterase-like isoform X3 [Schistocerca nitens]